MFNFAKNQKNVPYNLILLTLLFFPVFTYFATTLYFSVNVPFWDDYDVFLWYVNLPEQDKFFLLFAEHNEHRIAFSRAIGEIMRLTMGHLDFRILVFIGNLGLLLLLYLSYHLFFQKHKSLLWFLPIPYILFFGFNWENATWATGALQNYWVLFFALTAVILFSKESYVTFFIALLFAVLATVTSGSGILIFPVLILWSVMQFIVIKLFKNQPPNLSSLTAIFRLLILLLVTAVVFYLYFHGYTKLDNHPSIHGILSHPFNAIQFFLVFLGSYTTKQTVALWFGVISLLIVLYLTFRKYFESNSAVYFFIVYLLLVNFAATLTRAGFGVEWALPSRYVIISSLLLVCLYIGLLDTIRITKFKFIRTLQYTLFLACIFTSSILFYKQIMLLSERRTHVIEGVKSFQNTNKGLTYPDDNHPRHLIEMSSKNKVYVLPQYD